MQEFGDMGKYLILAGVFLIIFGLIFTFWGKIPFLGHLPGDFSFQKGNISFFIPLATSIIISLVLTIVINLFIRLIK
jgi:hypothetical protein